VGLYAAALIAAPWVALIAATLVYTALIPMSVLSYAKVKRARRAALSTT
jgi:CDP-diacylglycerol---serine O-phosphatidyltransferase